MRLFNNKAMWLILLAMMMNFAHAGRYSNRVTQLAEDYRENLNGKKLYGETFRSSITQDGVLACARVVQIVSWSEKNALISLALTCLLKAYPS